MKLKIVFETKDEGISISDFAKFGKEIDRLCQRYRINNHIELSESHID